MASHDEALVSSLVVRLARQVTARHDLEDVLAETFRCLRPLVEFGGGSIQLLDDDGYIRMVACDPVAPPHVLAHRVPLGNSVAGRVILTEQPVYLPDLDAPSTGSPTRKVVTEGVRAYLGVPLVADGRAVGLLQIDSPQVQAWTPEERQLVMTVAPIVAAAIQNARSHARAAAASARATAAGQRLTDAARLVATIRSCVEARDIDQLLRQLHRLERLVGEAPSRPPGDKLELPRERPQLPAPRLAVG